ncbi:MAG: DUF6115 domain-containing protein [Blautia sp.]|nr:DUF6115 domain-containing protein [Blautia sp.]MCM1201197.1 DUF6115 domain-containing protein [Bacteroides fragilis]
MSVLQIVLIIAGIVIFILGYLIPSKKKDMDETVQLISEDEVRKVVDKEIEAAKTHISDVVDETVTYAMEKTERSMERVTNEKIMAVNEYSDTVLEEINKNHKEVLFLYDMLSDKHDSLKDTVSEAGRTAEEIKQTVRDAEITAKETQESVRNVENTVREAEDAVRAVMNAALEARGRSTVPVYAEIVEKSVPRNFGTAGYGRNFREIDVSDYRRGAGDTGISGYRREIRDAGVSEYDREIRDAGVSEYDREIRDAAASAFDEEVMNIGVPEFAEEDVDAGSPEYSETVPDIGVPEFIGEETDTAEIETDREAAYAEAMEVARAAAYNGMTESAGGMPSQEAPQAEAGDQFVPIAPPRVEIIHDPDSAYDYVAEPPQTEERIPTPEAERQAEARPVNIQFTSGKNNGRNSNERILELHKAGKSNMAIAKELGLGIGEVKLVIDLFEGL